MTRMSPSSWLSPFGKTCDMRLKLPAIVCDGAYSLSINCPNRGRRPPCVLSSVLRSCRDSVAPVSSERTRTLKRGDPAATPSPEVSRRTR